MSDDQQPSLQDVGDPEKGGARRRPNADKSTQSAHDEHQRQQSGGGFLSTPQGGDKDMSRNLSRTMSRQMSRRLSAGGGGDEYSNLVKYIQTYRDKKDDDGGDHEEVHKRLWYAPWKRSKVSVNKRTGETVGAAGFKVPETWLETEPDEGLTDADVEERTRLAGHNELVSEKENQFLKFLSYFQGPILYVMEVAVLLAAGLRDWIDMGVIIGILMLNAVVGWYQEKQAADIVSKLKGDISMRATVVRNGDEHEIFARELVPGDIIIIEDGSTVPADARLLFDYNAGPGTDAHAAEQDRRAKLAEQKESGKGKKEDSNGSSTAASDEEEVEDDDDDVDKGPSICALDQSAITGESLAVDKFVGDTIFYTTGCKRGKAVAIVTVSAKGSFVGRTASMVTGAQDQGHFKKIMNQIGSSLLILVMFWILVAWIGGFFHGLGIATPESSSVNLLHYALILLIVGVPVGLPVVTTTTLAVGAAYLAKRRAIVQKLTAIESLAGVDILCSDKTGTLTANQLSIQKPFTSEGVDVNWMMAVAAMASSHNTKSLDPIDKVTVLTLRKYPKAKDILTQGWKTESYTPFDPVSKRITSVVSLKGETYTCAKGAPNAILKLCAAPDDLAKAYRAKAIEFAKRGFRSLGVSCKKGSENWQLLGMLPMFDPPREDTAATIAEAQVLGVGVKMLTGDAVAIAKETCKMLQLGTKVYNSERLVHGGLSGSQAHDFIEKADGFAEVFPEHKYQVVEMLQQRGHLTAMTGDGVNDAPSLKKADCGIAVEGASEAAQAAADIVFLAPGLSTIVDSIKVARQIFHRMKAYIVYRIALCLHLEIFLVTSMVIRSETIRVDLIVFLALFADLATVAVAYDNAPYAARPVEWQLPKIWIISVILGILLALGTWVIRATLFLPDGGIIQNFGSYQEILFLEISLTENWLIFVTRGGGTLPSWQLVGAIFGVDVIATLFSLFGWLSGTGGAHNGWTDVVTVVKIWLYSFGVIVVIAMVYYVLNAIPFLDNLGRTSRSNQNKQLEDVIMSLQTLALKHERLEGGGEQYRIESIAKQAEEE